MHDVTNPTAEGNFADVVRRAAQRGGDRPALRSHDEVLTWGELDRQVDAVAAGLLALGLPDDRHGRPRVAIALPNVPEFAAVFFGVLRAGLVAVPVNPAYTSRELNHVLGDSGAAVLVATRPVMGAAGDGAPPARYTLGENLGGLLNGGESVAQSVGGGEDLAVLLYTSGTAGAPKGAMLPHRALLANHEQLARIEPAPVTGDDVLLLAVPLFHAYGLNSGLGAVAYHGGCGVLIERFDPADALEAIERHGVTGVIGVPPMFIAWSLMGERLARAWAGVRLAVCGASPLDPAAERRFAETTGRAVHQGYGLTEAAPVLTSTLASPSIKPGSIGRPIPGVEVRLVDAEGEDVAPDEEDGTTDPGEIVARGRNFFQGYWPEGSSAPDPDGWWATGDVAYADEDGDLFIVDRLGELILVSGFNVYPHEVESVLAAHEEVAEAAAVGVPHPYTGQTVKAVVVRRPGSQVTAEELVVHCERNLARFKCPTAVEFVAELPHSATGKVRKGALG
ncbi:AMP-binding protein [Dactylosporangium salmoneum]|uniref:Long-chain fatty acid--CoA ligase n=1 Tax=Dactylosporangium salmoneum TaxID=53361 RepID=A0ABP5UFL3_9ACTN